VVGQTIVLCRLPARFTWQTTDPDVLPHADLKLFLYKELFELSIRPDVDA
jgi:hypothetical protein